MDVRTCQYIIKLNMRKATYKVYIFRAYLF